MSIQPHIWMLCALIGAASVLGTCAFPQNARPPDTLNPSLFQLQHTSWTEREGAPPQINDIVQAPDGSLWLGSGEGLYRFDGFTFERVRSIDGDSPAPTEIFCLLATSNGDLWIGTTLNGAILLRNGEVRRFPKFEGLPLNTTVFSLVNDLDGTIWAGTAFGTPALRWLTMAHRRESVGASLKWCNFFSSSIQTEHSGLRPDEHRSFPAEAWLPPL